jgi:hypothetical protein
MPAWPLIEILILGVGIYDLATRRRLHPAYVAGVLWVAANEVTGAVLHHSPVWKTVALKLIGH